MTSKSAPPKKDETLDDVEGTLVYNSKTGQYDKVKTSTTTKVDTIAWKTASPKVTPAIGSVKQQTNTKTNTTTSSTTKTNTTTSSKPIDYSGTFRPSSSISIPKNSKIKESYSVAMMLPFFSDKFSELDRQMYDKSYWAMNFYGGARLALDSLDAEGIALTVNVLDTKANEQTVATLLGDNAVKSADLIIGGETKGNVKLIADYAKLSDKLYVSPYSSNIENIGENQNFIQISPNLKTYCEAMLRSIRTHNTNTRIVCVTRADKPNEKETASFIQQIAAEIPFSEVSSDAFTPSIQLVPSMTTVFVIPANKDETYIYSLLKKIEAAKNSKSTIIVYGMPSWLNFSVNGFDSFEALKVRIPTSSFVDKDSPRSKGFARAFFSIYNTAPTDEAYQGYDIMLYMGRMMKAYGTKFSEVVELAPYYGLSTHYIFDRDKNSNDLSRTNRFQNKYVNILKFENGFFQLENN
jgi:ABC-type branched-subunit amino acid transport system substrate-binding protein